MKAPQVLGAGTFRKGQTIIGRIVGKRGRDYSLAGDRSKQALSLVLWM
jgi:hypothetical protein